MKLRDLLLKAALPLALILSAIALPLYSVKIYLKEDYTDFGVYHLAAERAQAGNYHSIYNFDDGASPFRYVPVTLPFFRPLAELPPRQARMVWFYLQFLAFGAGFWLLSRAVRDWRIAAASALFIFRFCLDTFTIGQVSSLMFLGFAAGLYGWMFRRPVVAGLGTFVPALFKIGPGVLYGLFAFGRPKMRRGAYLSGLLGILTLNGLTWAWLGSWDTLKSLWANWATVVAQDSVYYDASHYGSQSVKSMLLRAVKAGWIEMAAAEKTHLAVAVLACAGTVLFWALRRPTTARGRGLFYCLGIFLFLWLMPETFKYALTALAFPVALLLSVRRPSRLSVVALVFGFLTLSLAGRDIIQPTLFFALQFASIPLLATLLLGAATFEQAWRESRPSWLSRLLQKSVGGGRFLPPKTLPEIEGSIETSLLLPLPLERSASSQREILRLRQMLKDAQALLTSRWPGSHEILLAPYGNPATIGENLLYQEALALTEKTPTLRLLKAAGRQGRSASLRDAFFASRGKTLLVAHYEQPCEFSFYAEAADLVARGFDLVRANRRLPETRFKVPVRLLPLVYGRHRLGLLFNRFARLLFPLATTDTHCGNFVIRRKLAAQVFFLQTAPDFLFDLELALIAQAHGAREEDLPVVLYLAREKTHGRMLREALTILTGLPRLRRQYSRGYYEPAPAIFSRHYFTADDWGISPAVNAGILELARLGVLRRVSLMSECRYLKDGLEELKRVPGIQLGLHFNLTYGKTPARPAGVLLEWLNPSRRLALRSQVQEELTRQLAVLGEAGVQPTYLDGHHHIHLVPGILPAIADILEREGIAHLRLPADRHFLFSPKLPLLLLSAWARPLFRRHGWQALPFFYPSIGDFERPGRIRQALRSAPPTEVITHPATHGDPEAWEHPDPYVSGRVREIEALRFLLWAEKAAEK